MITKEELAKKIDQTLLKPFVAEEDVKKFILEAKEYNFRGVCVPPIYVKLAKELLRGTDILLVTIVGFPLGYVSTEVKVFEAIKAKADGADEIDMVMNISKFKSGDFSFVEKDIRAVVKAVEPLPVKVIIETGYLMKDEIKEASVIAVEAGAKVVKTSTGFGPRGATEEDIKLIKEAIGDKALIKAAGGIRDAEKALRMLKAGAHIIGSSSGVKILETFSEELAKRYGI